MDGQCQLGLYKLAGAPTRTPMASAGSGHGGLVNLLALISEIFFCMDDAYNYIYTRIIIYMRYMYIYIYTYIHPLLDPPSNQQFSSISLVKLLKFMRSSFAAMPRVAVRKRSVLLRHDMTPRVHGCACTYHPTLGWCHCGILLSNIYHLVMTNIAMENDP